MNSYFIIFIILVLRKTWVARALGDRLRPPINNYTINIYIFLKKIKAQKNILRL
jgi:hypothetical protein